ncbi:helix-turn-helix domain-containing protein, partial [Rhizobium johnstonii]|uniref:helix-turn-helix domain-containing protein n=1 Tax=Rhizobium johnstonii TaxID=3019933 RepID=UPI003F9557DD
EAVGAFLRRTRTDQQRILSEVAATAGVSTQYLSEVERGLKEPSSEILAAVVGALGLTLLYMTLGVGAQLQQDRA